MYGRGELLGVYKNIKLMVTFKEPVRIYVNMGPGSEVWGHQLFYFVVSVIRGYRLFSPIAV